MIQMTKEDNEYYAKNREKIQVRRKELKLLNIEEFRRKQNEQYHKKIGMRKCRNCGKDFISSEKFRCYCCGECQRTGIKKREKIYKRTYARLYYQENRNNTKEKNHLLYLKRRAILKQKIIEQLGDSCKICGSKQNIEYHNIKLIRHPSNLSYILAHIEDFVCLCGRCHRAKTRLTELTLEQKEALLKL